MRGVTLVDRCVLKVQLLVACHFFYFLSETVANLGKARPNLQPGGLLLARLTTVTSQMQTHVL